jgi:N-acetyl-gamma-glutamyl-phosphate reductase
VYFFLIWLLNNNSYSDIFTSEASSDSKNLIAQRGSGDKMKPKVYIDGREGTTGLQIYDRLSNRTDIDLLLIDESKRKDSNARKELLNSADIVFLCLPDLAAREAVSLIENTTTRVIDASTADRTAPD